MSGIEILGYVASVVVALSLSMSSIVRLRWLNMGGAALFSTYGFLIGAMPVALLNGYIVLANVFYLFSIYTRSDRFQMVEARTDDPLVRYWLNENKAEIDRFFPDFDVQRLADPVCSLMLRNNNPVGLLVGRQQGDTFEVAMDYVFTPYRDYRTGQFLYRDSGYFRHRRVRQITARSQSKNYQSYLRRMGFQPVPASPDRFEFKVKA